MLSDVLEDMSDFGLGARISRPPRSYRPKYSRLDNNETSLYDGSELILIFSEFNNAGRTFYPGDNPYWEAVGLHYW